MHRGRQPVWAVCPTGKTGSFLIGTPPTTAGDRGAARRAGPAKVYPQNIVYQWAPPPPPPRTNRLRPAVWQAPHQKDIKHKRKAYTAQSCTDRHRRVDPRAGGAVNAPARGHARCNYENKRRKHGHPQCRERLPSSTPHRPPQRRVAHGTRRRPQPHGASQPRRKASLHGHPPRPPKTSRCHHATQHTTQGTLTCPPAAEAPLQTARLAGAAPRWHSPPALRAPLAALAMCT